MSVALGLIALIGGPPQAAAQQDRCYPKTAESSRYVRMPDGVGLAVTIFRAPGRGGDRGNPSIAEFTRYGRLTVESDERREAWCTAGFNFVVVDTRGSGASFGSRLAEVSPLERADIGNMIDWIAAQSWSNGRVLVTGLSYDADTAEMATGTLRPALAGALVRHSEFDVYRQIVFPGGVAAKVGIDLWGEFTHAHDIAEECLSDVGKCRENPALAPVDADTTLAELRHAIAAHQQNARADRDFGSITFADDYFPSGVVASSIGASAVKKEIAAGAVPVQEWASWMDAGTVQSALERFQSFPHAATEIYIAAWTHGGSHMADPFFSDGGPVVMDVPRQLAKQLEFLQLAASGAPVRRIIHYVPLDSSTWKETDIWPPARVAMTTWYFSDRHTLVRRLPKVPGEDRRPVDFAATSGTRNRWRGNFFTGPIDYGDRAAADGKLSHFDTDELPEDLEIAGDVIVRLNIRVDRTDAALFVYFEDVAPDGRVTYLTEGELRLMHRSVKAQCDRTFSRLDALPVNPGQPVQATLCLEPVAAHVKAKHRLRIAIAGADADTFARYPASGPLNLDILQGGTSPTAVDVPTRPWR